MGYSPCRRIYISGEHLGKLQAVLENSLRSHGTSISYFTEHRDCLQELRETPCDLLVIDVEDDPKEGLDVLAQAMRAVPTMVILYSFSMGFAATVQVSSQRPRL